MSDATASTTQIGSALDPAAEAAVKAMIEAGVFFGRSKRHANPKMRSFVLHSRNGIEIFNLTMTLEALRAATEVVRSIVARDGLVLFVATQPAFADLVEQVANESPVQVVSKRWLGGTLTNFAEISKRIAHMKKLRTGMATGEFDKYTKKERGMLEREINKLEGFLGGIEDLNRKPDLMIVIDPIEHATAVAEANRVGVPVVAFANVDAVPEAVTHLVPGNSAGRASVAWFLEHLRAALATPRIKQAAEEATPVPVGRE